MTAALCQHGVINLSNNLKPTDKTTKPVENGFVGFVSVGFI